MRLLPLLLLACTGPVPGTNNPPADPASPPADTDAPSSGDTDAPSPADTDAPTSTNLRVATFNVSLYRTSQGALADELRDDDESNAAIAAAILQDLRADVVLLNEVDFDASGEVVDLLRTGFLEVAQEGRAPLSYPYAFVPEVNTGVPSGLDLDGDGVSDHPEGTQGYGNDAFGFGEFPGQYGMVLLSRYPITASRTFRLLRWDAMPSNAMPADFYSEAAAQALRLSSKTHADVTVDVEGTPLHLLISHPTPPAFDGAEQRNKRRNQDEIRLWVDYLHDAAWITDDDGVGGGLGDASFVILGDLNADPHDGNSLPGAIDALLDHPRVHDTQPTSAGAVRQATGSADANHVGPHNQDTADFAPWVGNLRVDYALPSSDLEVTGSGVLWPEPEDPTFPLFGTFPHPLTDHRPVWVDVVLRSAPADQPQ